MNKLRMQCKMFIKGLLILNLLWFLASIFTDTTVIPNPIDVFDEFGTVVTDKMILHILYSIRRIGLGLLFSLLIGIPVGILMAYSKRANQLLYPLIYFSYPVPKTAFLPIAMILWGMRDGSKIAIIFLIIVFQVIISVRDSVEHIDKTMYQVVVSSGANKIQVIWHITLPAILPELFTSIRVSLGTAVSILFFIEGYGTKYGLGYYILDAWSRINYIDMYIGIIVISSVGFFLFVCIDLLSSKLCHWMK